MKLKKRVRKIVENNIYKNAILDQFNLAHISYNENLSPYENISYLISYHNTIALDTKVSKEAQALVEQGYKQAQDYYFP